MLSYFVTAKQKQATFNGKQQRGVVCSLPFMVDALFGDEGADSAGPSAMDPEHEAGGATASVGLGADISGRVQGTLADAAGGGGDAAGADDGYDGDNDEEAVQVQQGFNYDWNAYHAAFKDMPVHREVTAMFAEYAVLYSSVAGQVTTAFPRPMTVDEGVSLGEQAANFINNFVTPLLGPIHSTKIHRLLCHVCECIKYHGNLKNGNTDANEAMHKGDKAYYVRTNKNPKAFTFQLVRNAQGSRALLAKLQAADDARAHERALTGVGRRASRRRRNAARRMAGSEGRAQKAYHLKPVPVGELAQRPGLSRLAALLHLHSDDKVRSLTRVAIDAVFECGGTAKQLLRSAADLRGLSWYDSVIYKPNADTDQRCVGEVRAIIRRESGDTAVIVEMATEPADDGCPLAQRGCTRLRWYRRGTEPDCAVRLVPLEHIVRVVHVVPDFGDLSARRGFDAAPAAPGAPLEDRLEMRYWLNVLYPWDV